MKMFSNKKNQLQLRSTIFDTRGKDEIFRRRGVYCESGKVTGNNGSCPPSLGNYRNLPGYHIQGMEIEAFYDSANLFGRLAYSTMKGKRDQSPRDPWFGQKTWIAEIQPDALHATLGMKIPQINMVAGWTGDFIGAQRRSPMDADPAATYWSLPKVKAMPFMDYSLIGNLLLSIIPRYVLLSPIYLTVIITLI
ncbi:hypothetical protein ACU42Y_07915 [Proteus mirabilis]